MTGWTSLPVLRALKDKRILWMNLFYAKKSIIFNKMDQVLENDDWANQLKKKFKGIVSHYSRVPGPDLSVLLEK